MRILLRRRNGPIWFNYLNLRIKKKTHSDFFNISTYSGTLRIDIFFSVDPGERHKKVKIVGRTAWNDAQIQLLKSHFADHIRMKIPQKKKNV